MKHTSVTLGVAQLVAVALSLTAIAASAQTTPVPDLRLFVAPTIVRTSEPPVFRLPPTTSMPALNMMVDNSRIRSYELGRFDLVAPLVLFFGSAALWSASPAAEWARTDDGGLPDRDQSCYHEIDWALFAASAVAFTVPLEGFLGDRRTLDEARRYGRHRVVMTECLLVEAATSGVRAAAAGWTDYDDVLRHLPLRVFLNQSFCATRLRMMIRHRGWEQRRAWAAHVIPLVTGIAAATMAGIDNSTGDRLRPGELVGYVGGDVMLPGFTGFAVPSLRRLFAGGSNTRTHQ